MRKILFLVVAVLLFIPVEYCFGLEGTVIVIAPDEWVHLALGGEPITSLSWLQYGEDVQVTFWAFNDSSVQFDSSVITANQTFIDPFKKFSLLWQGNFTPQGEIIFTLSSPLGIATTIVEKFPGEVPRYGKPAMSVMKTVITSEGELWDVIVDEVHVATFEWSFVTLSSNETGSNQTFPELKVYNSDGTEYDTKILTTTYVPLVDYYDIVGWMVSTITGNYVKWTLYAGKPIQVKISQGFTATALPFFIIYPKSLTVQSGDPVTIRWILPENTQTYTASWNETYMQNFLNVLNEEFDPSTGEYEVQLVFNEGAVGRRFRLEVEAEKYGTTYRSGDRVEVVSPAWKQAFGPVIGGGIMVVAIVILFIVLLKRRRSPPSPEVALKKVMSHSS